MSTTYVDLGIGSGGGAPDLLLRAAACLAPTDGRLAREVYLEALSLEIAKGLDNKSGVDAVCTAAQGAPLVPGSAQPTDLALDGLIKRFTEGYGPAVAPLRRALDAFASWDDLAGRGRWVGLMTCIAIDLWDDERRQEVRAVPDEGPRRAGRPGVLAEPNLGMVGCADHRSVSTEAYGEAVICNGEGRYEEARAAAAWAVECDDLGLCGWALSELVEAATRTGDKGAATQALTELRSRTQPSGTDVALGIESRAQALVTEGAPAEDHYRASIEYLARTNVNVHLARSHLLYGEWLRREGRRVEARRALRGAQLLFDELGSSAFGERTRRELVATGETVHKRTVTVYNELTPQELEIAQLASCRLTNSEIAMRLFISPRTVEWHLRKVFTKLGVTSRRELRLS